MSLGLYIIDEHGDVVPCEKTFAWAKWLEPRAPVQVARTILDNGVKISTIFLAIDYGLSFLEQVVPTRPALVFETMIFFGQKALDQFRYPDWSTAAADHLRLVAEWAQREPNG